ncbi:hypothetical protein [Nocardioides mangrovi]|uniref:Uncharacterized protein n=1 Tax=Nocardioides mangrovi TaxID=2874580 RepID=A0ABS7UKF0_9ACTN|nr:hypothetical protein [Nocardioides mangrovi]MBZ5741072.1 hypothetical protein [Nocardioides mangrovi]
MTTLNHRYPAIQGEYEDEFEYEDELEEEYEDEAFLGALGKIAGSLLGEEEYEDEYELESEYEFEDEFEDEAFLGGLAKIAGSLLGEGEYEGEYEDEAEMEFEFEAEAEAEMESEMELEDEFEDEAEEEAEGFVNPVRRIYRDAESMAHLAVRAERAQSEAEAEAFVGALVPLASKLIPRAAKLIARNAPTLVKGASRIVRQLRRNPQTRRMVRALPVVLQRTAQSLADQAANGRDIDATTVVRTLGTMTGRVLGPRRRRRAIRAVNHWDRRWHRRARWARGRGRRYRVHGRGVRRPYSSYNRGIRRPVTRRPQAARRVRRR